MELTLENVDLILNCAPDQSSKTNNCVKCSDCTECNSCYNCDGCISCNDCKNCQDCIVCKECSNCYKCTNCIKSNNLNYKQYCVLNKQFTAEEYLKIKKAFGY